MTTVYDSDQQQADEFIRIQALEYASKAHPDSIYHPQDFLERAAAIEKYIRTGKVDTVDAAE